MYLCLRVAKTHTKGLFINDVITRGGGGVSQKMTNDDMMTEGVGTVHWEDNFVFGQI